MQGRKYKVAGLGNGNGRLDGFKVTHLADKYDVGVFTKSTA